MILIGTSGFSYDDWKGYFYPNDLKKSDMLAYYAKRFPAVEVNSTYYAIPSAPSFSSMAKKTPPEFQFVVKAHRDMAHAENPESDVFRRFTQAIEPLANEDKLGCVLAQYPWGFKPSDESTGRLKTLRDMLEDIPVVVEFRNSNWASGDTFAFLRELQLGYCSVDEPHLQGLMPDIAAYTSPVGYVRFHGRNAAKWWSHEEAWERYDYLYSKEELSEWVSKIRDIAEHTEITYLFFNNHYRGQSAKNARMLAQMLSLPFGDDSALQPSLYE